MTLGHRTYVIAFSLNITMEETTNLVEVVLSGGFRGELLELNGWRF